MLGFYDMVYISKKYDSDRNNYSLNKPHNLSRSNSQFKACFDTISTKVS